jgi:hypothetical protein
MARYRATAAQMDRYQTLLDKNAADTLSAEERAAADVIAQCFLCFRQSSSPTAILDADIRDCFETISHEWLLKHIPCDQQKDKLYHKSVGDYLLNLKSN